MKPTVEIRQHRALLASALSLLVFALALYALHRVLQGLAWGDVRNELVSLPLASIVLAMAAAMGSYFLLTTFDLVGVRLSGKSVPLGSLIVTAFIANALGHNLGMAPLTGGTVRARSYAEHGLSMVEVGQIIASATLGFLLGALFWLGCALTWEPDYISQTVHAPPSVLQWTGPVLLLSLALAGLMLSRGGRSFSILSHTVRLPTWRVGGVLLLASAFELALAAGALYALLPPEANVSFLAFIGLYVAAVALGVVSTVPAGLGVFEASMLVMLPSVPPHTLLASILAYRAVYYVMPLLLALALLGLRSMRGTATGWRRGVGTVRRWTDPLVAPAFAVLIFAAGASLVITGSLPLAPAARSALAQSVALPTLELSHLAGSAIGVVLLVLANGVYQRIRLAWWLSLCGLAFAVVLTLVVGFRWPLALALAALLVPLWSARARFYRDQSLLTADNDLAWIRNVMLVIAAAAWLGLLVHRNVQYDNDLWWQFAFESDAPRMLRGLLVALLVLAGFGFARLLWPGATAPPVATDRERDTAAAILRDHGRADAKLALLPDKQLLIAESADAFIMYQHSGPYLIAMGDPVGPPTTQAQLAWRFRELADRAGLATVFYQVSVEHLPIYLDLGLALTKLGEEALIPLAEFSLEGSKRADLRQEHRRAVREGARFAMLRPAEVPAVLPRLREISDQWLEAKESTEKRFSLGYFEEQYLTRCPCAVVKQGDRIVAFANVWTTTDLSELSIDLMRHVDDGPRHAMDFLFVELMLWGKVNGYREFNLGMAPLAGLSSHALAPLWHKLGDFAWRHGERFYHFEGLRRYKNKYAPEWRPRYLASQSGIPRARVLFHVSRLVSGSLLQVIFRQEA